MRDAATMKETRVSERRGYDEEERRVSERRIYDDGCRLAAHRTNSHLLFAAAIVNGLQQRLDVFWFLSGRHHVVDHRAGFGLAVP